MSTDAGSIAAAYFEAWVARDFGALHALLADDVTFDGPFACLDCAADCVKELELLSEILTEVIVRKTFVDGDDVLTWFDLHTTVAEPVPTAIWSRVRDGKITNVRVAFDARRLASPDPPAR
jgi:ketosteroid isomerase-like protein